MIVFRLILLLLASVLLLPAGKSRTDIPLAPLPARIVAAHKVFIVNGGDDLAYDTVYAAFKQWPRYTIVDSAADADIAVEIRLVVTDLPRHHSVHVNGRELPDPPLMLIVSDAASKEQLWSSLERRGRAIKQKNRDKETIDAADRLVGSLKARM